MLAFLKAPLSTHPDDVICNTSIYADNADDFFLF